MNSSLSRNEAWGKVFGSHLLEYGLSGLGGMLSGAVTGLGGVGINALTGGFKKLDTSKIEKHEIKTPEEAKTEKKDTKYPEPYEIIKDAKNAPAYSDYYKYAEMVEKSDKLTSENILRLEELWKKHQDLPEAISEIKELAGEGKTLDEVEKSVRKNYDVETITYAEIEDAYNEAAEKQMAGTKATDKEYISMEDFANSESTVWHNVDYNDDASKSNIMQEVHDSMVSEGSVVQVSDSTLQNVGESYPDLRGLKKKERTPLLKEAMSKLKNNLKQFLGTFKNQSFDFEVNGKILEAKLYNTGINEVLEKITQEKANMLYTTEEIFKNARYLYSTTDYDGDPNVYRWNYFYTPVQIGEDIVGVRIAVRDVATPKESQIYNWNIKKDTSLDGVGRGTDNRISHGVSSDVSNNSISQNTDFDNTFSKNNNESADLGNESAESHDKNELDEPEENEITNRIAEIEDERSWREPSDPARDRFYADEADLIRDLKAKGEYENHPIRKARTETARSGIVYGASESDIALAERLSKALGRDILFFSEEARNDDIKNGVWDRDAIWINVKHDPEKTVLWIIAHELAHTIEGTKAYGKLKKYVRSELSEEAFKKQCDDLLKMYSPSEVEFEVVSNYVADHLLTDEASIMKLVRGNRTLAEKLLSVLDKILEKIGITEERLALERMRRIYLDALAEQANAAQPRDGMDSVGEGQKKKTADVDSLSGDEYLKELDSLLDSGEITEDEYNELYEEYISTSESAVGGRTKFAISKNTNDKITSSMTDSERTAILSTKRITVPIYEGQADLAISKNKKDIESSSKSLIKTALIKIGEEFGIIGEDIDIENVEVVVSLSKSNIKESASKSINPVQIAKLLAILKPTAEHSIGIENHNNRYFSDTDTVYFENLIGGYIDGENLIPVRFGLKRSMTGHATLYVVVDQNKIPLSLLGEKEKTEVIKATGIKNPPKTSRSVTYSISQIVPFVNSKDILRYLPDGMLSEEQKKIKWDAIAETVIYTNNKNDKNYTEFLSKGNINAARQMVLNAAKAAGYDIVAYHGTNNQEEHSTWNAEHREWDTSYTPFTVFKKQYEEQVGHFFSSDKDNAGGYGSNVYSVCLMMKNPLIIECNGQSYSHISFAGKEMDTYEWAEYAREHRYDGVVFKNVRDGVGIGDLSEVKKNEFTESEMKVVSALSGNGFTAEEAEGMVKEFEKIEPTNGRKKAGQYQKAESIVNTVFEPKKQLDALSAVMSNKQYQIMKLAYETYNIEPSLYIKVYLAAEKLSYETTSKTDVNKTELKTVLDDLELNDGKKAQLYQFITNEDVTLNPFSFEHANYVKEDMDALFA